MSVQVTKTVIDMLIVWIALRVRNVSVSQGTKEMGKHVLVSGFYNYIHSCYVCTSTQARIWMLVMYDLTAYYTVDGLYTNLSV